MKIIRLVITVLSVLMFVACVDDTQVGQSSLLNNDIVLDTVDSEPDNAPTNEPVASDSKNTSTSEPIISKPDNTPTPEPVISKPDNNQTPTPIISEPDNEPTPSPTVVVSPIFDWTTIKTKEEFHDIVAIANGASDTDNVYASSDMDDKEIGRLAGLSFYYDFVNLVEDVVLYEINVHHGYVIFEYLDKEGIGFSGLALQTFRGGGGNVDVEQFIAGRRRSASPNVKEITINGNRALKDEVFWDTSVFTGHICNQYHWVQDGYSIFLRVPTWLLDRYPEETFFDIQRIDIQ